MQDAGPDATIDPLRQLEDKLDELLTGLREQTGQAQAQTLEHLACYSESLDELQVMGAGRTGARSAKHHLGRALEG